MALWLEVACFVWQRRKSPKQGELLHLFSFPLSSRQNEFSATFPTIKVIPSRGKLIAGENVIMEMMGERKVKEAGV